MCRLAAYLGEKIPLADLINKPHYNLYEQSWQAREMSYGKVNADGFGFGWYDRHGKAGIYRKASPCLLYTSPSPRDRQKSRMPSSA